MSEALTVHRLQFAFTVTYHYLFPQLTMGLALILVLLRTLGLRTSDAKYVEIARFLQKIFLISFGFGVVTGIPMEFQFGTNWAAFSRGAGSIVGQTLAMEGVFAFFLESSFLGFLIYGEDKLGERGTLVVTVLLFIGSWLSGFFIIVTDAWMQHPVGYVITEDGTLALTSLLDVLLNEWAWWQFAHNMLGATVTGAFVSTGIAAFYLLSGRATAHAETLIRVTVPTALAACVLLVFPTGDQQGRLVAQHQPVTLAAMEGLFDTHEGAPLALIGQPNVDERRLDNPLEIPNMLSFLTYKRWKAEVRGLDAFPEQTWPDNIPLLYFAYHVMVGLGTMFIAVLSIALLLLLKKRLTTTRPALYVLMLFSPLPFVANTAGWMTAELGRQPWLIYGVLKTADGASPHVGAGNAMFTLLGYMGLYTVLSLLYVLLIVRELEHGPEHHDKEAA
ncbi:MAG: cytochrome ubiquinol oxidase subunit I [Deltaproteobacteria bacterium]